MYSRLGLRSPSVLFNGLEDYDGNVHRPFVSGFSNNSVVSSPELPALVWQAASDYICAIIDKRVPSHFTSATCVRPGYLSSPLSRLPSHSKMNGLVSHASAFVSHDGDGNQCSGLNWSTSPRFAGTHLPACDGYAGLIHVLLALFCALWLTLNLEDFSLTEDDAAL
ncbi:hypothetical protein MVEN_01598200 [Mycena venus]|uniref:Uncharacterized protein n=1 Tax=Mycena venus TaxID=2733690 RepID=A0A8H7CPV9_9AGAR|nr:hypothetical protein MVEN_01598200 [Mycena venus]